MKWGLQERSDRRFSSAEQIESLTDKEQTEADPVTDAQGIWVQ